MHLLEFLGEETEFLLIRNLMQIFRYTGYYYSTRGYIIDMLKFLIEPPYLLRDV